MLIRLYVHLIYLLYWTFQPSETFKDISLMTLIVFDSILQLLIYYGKCKLILRLLEWKNWITGWSFLLFFFSYRVPIITELSAVRPFVYAIHCKVSRPWFPHQMSSGHPYFMRSSSVEMRKIVVTKVQPSKKKNANSARTNTYFHICLSPCRWYGVVWQLQPRPGTNNVHRSHKVS